MLIKYVILPMLELYLKRKLREAGGKTFVGQSLVALDTDHIKGYVFGTNKLKEIRGASSLLDTLNRKEMKKIALSVDPQAEEVYANGGSGLFLLDSDKAKDFGQKVKEEYRKKTGGGASITYVEQEIPANIKDVWHDDIWDILELLRYRLREEKNSPPDVLALPSHPFMRPCHACGIEYAEGHDKTGVPDPDERDALFCASCLRKREEDDNVRDCIEDLLEKNPSSTASPLWDTLIAVLRNINYRLPRGTKRPSDFNVFRNFKGAKDYFGLIYADANGMGKKLEELRTLEAVKQFAEKVDDAVYRAVCDGIEKYLAVGQHAKQNAVWTGGSQEPLFPFDILLIGGDDVLMVTPASVAMDVALTIAEQFHERTHKKHTLSVGIVLAPVKYPFGLLQDIAESTLKFAKTEGTRTRTTKGSEYGDTRINFVVVAGTTSHDFKRVYRSLYDKKKQVGSQKQDMGFYATLRPYTVEHLTELLNAIRDGNKLGLGRTKLHQVREAVLKKNLTTSVQEGLAVLRNWRAKQRETVVNEVYKFGGHYQLQYSDPENPATMFPRVTFPWFADGTDTYRTFLLDFVELYDFVAREEVDGDNKD